VLDPNFYNYGGTPSQPRPNATGGPKYAGDPAIRYVGGYYYVMHSEPTHEPYIRIPAVTFCK